MFNASVVRIQNENVGLRFNYTGKTDPVKKELKKYLESKLLPRYSITIPCDWVLGNTSFKSEILNISEGGFFLSTSEQVKLGDLVSFSFKIFGFNFSGNGTVSWVNSESKYNKPIGIGISYTDLGKDILYTFFIFCFRIFTNFETRDR